MDTSDISTQTDQDQENRPSLEQQASGPKDPAPQGPLPQGLSGEDDRELVPGDIIRLRLGDIIPADAQLIQGD